MSFNSFPTIPIASTPTFGVTPTVVATTMATLTQSTLFIVPSGLPTNPQAATSPMATTAVNPYIYAPSFSIAVVGSISFLIAGFILSAQLIRNKAWYFNLIPQAALLEAAGMIARTDSTLHVTNLTAFAAQVLATAIPESLVAIGDIFTFTRIMWWVTPTDKRNHENMGVPVKWVSAIWASMSVTCDILKAIGSTLRTNPTAQKVEMVGLILQFFVFTAFTMYSARFMWRARRWLISGEAEAKSWERLGWTVVGVMGTLAVCHLSLQLLTLIAINTHTAPLHLRHNRIRRPTPTVHHTRRRHGRFLAAHAFLHRNTRMALLVL